MKRKNVIIVAIAMCLAMLTLQATASEKKKPSRMDRSKLNIGAYILQPYARTEAHVKDVADCGIDFIVCMGYDMKTLDLFRKYHVGAVVTGVLPGWWGGDGANAGKLSTSNPLEKYDSAATKFKDHPAIWGIDIGDEPSALDFPYYHQVYQRVSQLFPRQFPYLNLYPNYASVSQNTAEQTVNQLGTSNYDDYIEQYCKYMTDADYICYDFYLYSINVPKAYGNLKTVADAALRYGKSMWIVLQVNSNKEEEWISENELRFQAYTAMAFGAENIIWACYTAGWWSNQVLDDKGNKTQQYDKLKAVNKEIHGIAKLYMKYRRTTTSFIDFEGTPWLEGVPARTLPEYNDNEVQQLQASDNTPLLVGTMTSRKGNGRKALFVCSADDPYDKAPKTHTVLFRTDKKVTTTDTNGIRQRLTAKTGNLYEMPIESNHAILIELH